jgi:hypothetical protein
MPIRNIDISEGIIDFIVPKGKPDGIEINIGISDWKRFVEFINRVGEGERVSFVFADGYGNTNKLIIKNCDNGVKNLGG